jgi:hypothetical protein
MSLFNRTSPASPPLQSRHAAAARDLQNLRDQLAGLALQAATSGDPADRAALAEHRRRLHEAETEAEDLRLALAEEERQRQARSAEGLAKVRMSQLAKVRAAFKKREAAALEYAAAIQKAKDAFDRMRACAAEAKAACPVGLRWADETELLPACARENRRIGGSLNPADPRMPGVGFDAIELPSQIPPLVEVLRAAGDRVARRLRDEIDTARLAAPDPQKAA